MKPRGILFSGAMVRAILDGRKTQTRRIVKDMPPMPKPACRPTHKQKHSAVGVEIRESMKTSDNPRGMGAFWNWELWVRETWAEVDQECRNMLGGSRYAYRADYDPPGAGDYGLWRRRGSCPVSFWGGGWRPSIHMPRKVSRISLTVTGIRVERVQDISEEDALAEGVEASPTETPREAYARLWDEINGAGAWAANPWVWAYTFQRKGGL